MRSGETLAGSRSNSSRALEPRIFKENPFDNRLRSHKIHKLSARYGRTIYSAEIEADLRAVYYVDGDLIVTVDIGSHSLYR